jgi:AcrR family transcriptional regulator
MPRPPTAKRDKVRSETRQQLLEAAAAEFTCKGYVGANINRISTAAGFAKGTIYNYFPSKRALMLALIDEIGSAHSDFILQQVEAETDPVQRLERFFSAGFTFVEENPIQAPVIINTIYGADEEFKEQVFKAYDRVFTLIIQDILGAGMAQGVFRAIDPDLAAALLMSVYLGSCSLLESGGKIGISPSQVVEFLLDGLGQRNPDPPRGREAARA